MLTYDDSAWANMKRELLLATSETAVGRYKPEYHPFTIVDKWMPAIIEETEIRVLEEAEKD